MAQKLESQAALLTVSRTAEILGISRQTVYDMIDVGQLKVVTPGRSRRQRVLRDSVMAFLASADPTPKKAEPLKVMPRRFLRGV